MRKKYMPIFLITFCLLFSSCTQKTISIEDKPPEESTITPNISADAFPEQKEYVKTPYIPPKHPEKSPAEREPFYKDRAVVLTYHHISTNPVSSITISPGRFESDLKMLKNDGFNIISFKEMIDGIEGKSKLPVNAVVITFDDGYGSFYKYAYPALKKYKVPAVCFIITSWTENYVPEGGELNSLGLQEINEMYQSGLVDIESHSHKGHEYIVKDEEGKIGGILAYRIYDPKIGEYEPEESYKIRVEKDLAESRDIIKKYIGTEPEVFCFPFGHYNAALVELGKKAGFKYFVTTLYGNNKANSKNNLIKRIRSGDAKLTTEKLKQNIIDCGRGKPYNGNQLSNQPATQ